MSATPAAAAAIAHLFAMEPSQALHLCDCLKAHAQVCLNAKAARVRACETARCLAITKKGTQCQFAGKRSGFCSRHVKMNQRAIDGEYSSLTKQDWRKICEAFGKEFAKSKKASPLPAFEDLASRKKAPAQPEHDDDVEDDDEDDDPLMRVSLQRPQEVKSDKCRQDDSSESDDEEPKTCGDNGGRTLAGKPCRRRAIRGSKRCSAHQDD